jgi:hypothetical protein
MSARTASRALPVSAPCRSKPLQNGIFAARSARLLKTSGPERVPRVRIPPPPSDRHPAAVHPVRTEHLRRSDRTEGA